MKAIGYVAGVYVDNLGNAVDTVEQAKRIRDFAAEKGIEIETIFEDSDESEQILERPGIRKLMFWNTDAEIVLVDRVWCLGRTCAALEPVLDKFAGKGMRLESATTCFDVTSQFSRFWYNKPGRQAYSVARQARELDTAAKAETETVKTK